MRKIVSLGSTVAAAMSFAGVAQADTIWDGYGSLAAGYHALSEQSGSYVNTSNGEPYNSGTYNPVNLNGLELDARVSVAMPVTGLLGAQFDGELNHTVSSYPASYEEAAYKSDGNTFAAHLFARNSQRGLIGVFVQRNGATSNYAYNGTSTNYAVGAETQLYLGKLTLYGQAAYASGDRAPNDFSYGQLGDGPAFNLQARYFPQENLALTLTGGYQFSANDFHYRNNEDVNDFDRIRMTGSGWLIGARSEYRLEHSHASIFLNGEFRTILNKYTEDYGYTGDYDNGNYQRNDLHDFRMTVGVKLNFGAKTLFERDRSGASLDPISSIFDGVAPYAGENED